MLDRREAKDIAQFVLKELRKSSYAYFTDGRFDYRKTGMGRLKGGTIGQIGPQFQHYVCDVVWTSTGENTIEWSAGSVKLADGRTQELNAGSATLVGTGLNYFWAVIGNSEIQTSTNYYDGVGDDKALLAYATKAPENDQLALVFPFFGTEPTFNSDVLSANMILAAHIKAGVITASHIQVGSITADRLSFTAFDINANTLDDVNDGTTYQRVLSTQLNANKIELTSTDFLLNEEGVIVGTLNGSSTRLTANGLIGSSLAGSITSISDAGGGEIQVTVISHGMVTGDYCLITGTTSYDGLYKITKVDDNNFKVTATYTSSQTGYALHVQVHIESSDGKMYAAGGDVIIDKSGITIKGAPVAGAFFTIQKSDGTVRGYILHRASDDVFAILAVSADLFLSAGLGKDIVVNDNVIPSADATYNLGSSTKRFAEARIQKMYTTSRMVLPVGTDLFD